MSQKAQILRSLVEQRLTAAAEEIFGLFERTIAEYEEELCRTKEENQRQRQILDCVRNPTVLIHKTDVQQLSVVKEEVPSEQQEWNPIVDLVEPEPEPPHIKEEQEELWTSQEANITKFPSTPVPVKSEDDDELKEIEKNKVDCGGSEPFSSFQQNEDCEETEDSDEDQTLNHKSESTLPTNSTTKQIETDGDDGGETEPDIILVHVENVRGRTFDSKSLLEDHMDTHTGQKLVGSSECEATFTQKKNMTQETNSSRDMMMNTDLIRHDVGCEKKLYHCCLCWKTFTRKLHLEIHMRVHTGEKPFSCSVCGSRFTQKSSLRSHMKSHMGEKPFRCSLCHKCFRDRSDVKRHMRIHTGERSCDCLVCGKRFTNKSNLSAHMRVHTGEKPFSCSECGKRFTQKIDLERHMRIHTGEKPFSCVVCQKCFTRKYHLQIHMKIHTRE